ncbi:hypothetical protein [Actinophytocola sp.]|nr:hypothetical protein [Actinophytocola sp.]HYQ68089.1 hypothetical protein [Actinophytocola sp.]
MTETSRDNECRFHELMAQGGPTAVERQVNNSGPSLALPDNRGSYYNS